MRKLLLLLFMALFAWAGGSDLSSKIARLQQLPKSERYKLMNEIKRDLARMNEVQRQKALGKLRASMHGKDKGMPHRNGDHTSSGMHRREGNGMGERMHQNMQHMNQWLQHQSPTRENMTPEKLHPQQRPSEPNRPHGR